MRFISQLVRSEDHSVPYLRFFRYLDIKARFRSRSRSRIRSRCLSSFLTVFRSLFSTFIAGATGESCGSG
ncbi:hypothetical protein BRD19_02460 [Halobacteriales archaeon SW_7_65_23]|nr:MAG: hypothetical protein BRD19_02460 [Halobacteriales archaeon SW_7_65_23]